MSTTMISHFPMLTHHHHHVQHIEKDDNDDSNDVHDILYHLQTIYLFVRSDLKTIMFPVGIFSHVASPSVSWTGIPLVISWLLLHLLLIDVDNQSLSASEDKINKPWRPLPSGRLTEAQAKSSLWVIYPACLIVSAYFNVFIPSLVFAFLVFVYDHGDLAGHWFWKNLVNAGGYLSLEIAATRLVAGGAPIDALGTLALITSGSVIFTTIHIQDIQDEAGDRIMGRKTVPIRFGPDISRGSVALMVMIWSFVLPALWVQPFPIRILVASLGTIISYRTYFIRDTKESDEATYRLFNVWLIALHLLIAPIRISSYLSKHL